MKNYNYNKRQRTFTSAQLDAMSDLQIEAVMRTEFLHFYPGKSVVQEMGWKFYMFEGEAYDIMTGEMYEV